MTKPNQYFLASENYGSIISHEEMPFAMVSDVKYFKKLCNVKKFKHT
jgi:hypothetical protein